MNRKKNIKSGKDNKKTRILENLINGKNNNKEKKIIIRKIKIKEAKTVGVKVQMVGEIVQMVGEKNKMKVAAMVGGKIRMEVGIKWIAKIKSLYKKEKN